MREQNLKKGLCIFGTMGDRKREKIRQRVEVCADCKLLTFAGINVSTGEQIPYYKCGGCNCKRDIVYRISNLQMTCPKRYWNDDSDE